MLKTNCKDCLYRQLLADTADCHVWGEDCDHYGDDFCRKMCDPGFIKFMQEKGGNHGQEDQEQKNAEQ